MRTFKNTRDVVAVAKQSWRHSKLAHQPLVIEIGAGAGLHPVQYATAHPDHFLVAIERTQVKFHKMAGRIKAHTDINNVHLVHADAVEWIAQNIQPGEVDSYFILYPNPYPKAKQANKRFMNMPFMAFLLKTLKPGGKITLVTNMHFYYLEAKTQFIETWKLKLLDDSLVAQDIKPRTHFEKKYLARGETCYQLVFTL